MKRVEVLAALLLSSVISITTVYAAEEGPAAQDAPPADESQAAGATPSRLSFLDGEVSFWRPGANDWVPAAINTPLAPGDALYTGAAANVELQIGPRAFARAGEETQLGLENQEPDFVQLKMTTGHMSLDVRAMSAGHTIELDTPNAAFTIETTGYYRVDVSEGTTTFITRRGGRATMIPGGGTAVAVTPSEQVVVEGTDTPRVETYVAPELDTWDRWNYDRTDQLIDAISTRYVSSGVYGVDDLDQYGNWRVLPQYGAVWMPEGVAAGWAPYTSGRWIWDPYYGWTWLDSAPWGWAPYHYGRWVHTNGFWGWAPGPLVVRPLYAPALVAFFGGGGFGVRIGFGTPRIGWCALGWGEPLVPWWGRPGFIGHPWWGGWGGPRVVNNVVVNRTTIINVNQINVYQNAHVPHAFVAVDRNRFGQGVDHLHLGDIDPRHFNPVHGGLSARPDAASLVPAAGHGVRPPQALLETPVVATRAPHDSLASLRAEGVRTEHAVAAPPPRLVTAPQHGRPPLSSRPPYGEMSSTERPRPPLPPRFEGTWHAPPPAQQGGATGTGGNAPRHYELGPSIEAPRSGAAQAPPPRVAPPRVEAPRVAPPRAEAPQAPPPRVAAPPAAVPQAPRAAPGGGEAPRVAVPQVQVPQAPRPPARELPGEPANRVYPGRVQAQPRQFNAPAVPGNAPAVPGVAAPGPSTGRSTSGSRSHGGGGSEGGGHGR